MFRKLGTAFGSVKSFLTYQDSSKKQVELVKILGFTGHGGTEVGFLSPHISDSSLIPRLAHRIKLFEGSREVKEYLRFLENS